MAIRNRRRQPLFWTDDRTKRAAALAAKGKDYPAIAAVIAQECGAPVTARAVAACLYRQRQASPLIRGKYGRKRPEAILEVAGLRVVISVEKIAAEAAQ